MPRRNVAFGDAELVRGLLRLVEHRVGHVDAVGVAGRPDHLGEPDHVGAATAAEIDAHLADAGVAAIDGGAARHTAGGVGVRKDSGYADAFALYCWINGSPIIGVPAMTPESAF